MIVYTINMDTYNLYKYIQIYVYICTFIYARLYIYANEYLHKQTHLFDKNLCRTFIYKSILRSI